MTCGWGVGYDVVHLCCVFVFKVGDDVIKLRRVLCDTRQSELPLKLCELHGWLFGPERRDSNTDAVDSTSRIRQLLRAGRCGSVFLHDACRDHIGVTNVVIMWYLVMS